MPSRDAMYSRAARAAHAIREDYPEARVKTDRGSGGVPEIRVVHPSRRYLERVARDYEPFDLVWSTSGGNHLLKVRIPDLVPSA